MDKVSQIEIQGVKWEIEDENAQKKIATLEEKLAKIIDVVFYGSATFNAHMKYLGEDSNYIYYNFWWEEQTVTLQSNISYIEIYPADTTNDKMINLNLNLLQSGNASIIQATQHAAGPNHSGMLTYIKNIGSNTSWIISGMGILRRTK